MNIRYRSLLIKILYILAIFSIGCNGEEGIVDDIGHETTDNKNINQKPPSFNVSGGWSLSGPIVPFHFCHMYLAADAFIFGSITAVEMTEDPFVVMDPETGAPNNTLSVQSIDECFTLTPVLKVTIETSAFLTNYEEIERQPYIYLYIGSDRMNYMEPFPGSDAVISWSVDGRPKKRMKTSQVYWENNRCRAGGPCPLEVEQQIGFFARYDKSLNVWYMSEATFWANSTDLGSLTPSLYENIQNKRSLMEIEDSTKECKDFISQYADEFRGEILRNQEINHALPQCRLD